MQNLKDVPFKRYNVLSWLSLSKIPSETKESEFQYSVTTSGNT